MANERIPEDPYRSGLSDGDFPRASSNDRDLSPLDRDFDGGPSGGKVALFAVAIALVLGAVFYALNNTSTHQAQNSPAQSAQTQNVAPRANTQPGMTTGAAPANPQATEPPSVNSPVNAPGSK